MPLVVRVQSSALWRLYKWTSGSLKVSQKVRSPTKETLQPKNETQKMKLCATLLSAHLVSAAPNHDSDRFRRQSAGSSGSIVSWDGLQHPDGWEPNCALRSTGLNHVPGVCTQYYECLNGQPTGVFNEIVRNCDPGTYWHPGFLICQFDWQVNCDAEFRQPVTCQVAESELSQCLDQFAGSIQFDGRVFEVVSLDRLMYNTGPTRFYKETGGDEFIYFDGQYDQWRIGGGSEGTQAVDCTTLPICA